MITLSVDDLLHGRLPEAYYLAPYVLYRVRNGAEVLYVGKAEQQSPQERLRQHLALDVDSDFFGQSAGPSALGRHIQEHAPDSNAWQIDLLTLGDAQDLANANERTVTVAQAERLLIQRETPRLNRANNAPTAPPRSERGRSPRTLPEHAEAFLTSRSANKRTHDTYRYALLRWQDFGQATGLTPMAQPLPAQRLNSETLGDFAKWLTASGLKPNSARTFLASVKQYVFWLQADGQLPASVRAEDMLRGLERTAGPHQLRLPPQRRQADDSIGVLLDYYAAHLASVPADTPRGRRQRLARLRNHAILQTLYSTAGRAGEVAALTQAQVQAALAAHPGEHALLPVKITGRGERERLIFLSLEAQAAIQAYLQARRDTAAPVVAQGDALFVRHDRDDTAPISTKTVWQIVNAAAKATFGVDAASGTFRRVGPHQLRHLRAQHLQAAGMPLESLQAILGHSNLLTTRRAYGQTPTPDQLTQDLTTYGRSAKSAAKG